MRYAVPGYILLMFVSVSIILHTEIIPDFIRNTITRNQELLATISVIFLGYPIGVILYYLYMFIFELFIGRIFLKEISEIIDGILPMQEELEEYEVLLSKKTNMEYLRAVHDLILHDKSNSKLIDRITFLSSKIHSIGTTMLALFLFLIFQLCVLCVFSISPLRNYLVDFSLFIIAFTLFISLTPQFIQNYDLLDQIERNFIRINDEEFIQVIHKIEFR